MIKQVVNAGVVILTCLGFSAVAQDWYHDRDSRFEGDQWRGQVFDHVRSDLDHIWSADRASDKERRRLVRTKQELADLQAKLQGGRYDGAELNDVIDSIRKSANDERLASRDRDVLGDDLNRLQDYREHHDHWNR